MKNLNRLAGTLELLQECLDEVAKITGFFGISQLPELNTSNLSFQLNEEKFDALVSSLVLGRKVVTDYDYSKTHIRASVVVNGHEFMCLTGKEKPTEAVGA